MFLSTNVVAKRNYDYSTDFFMPTAPGHTEDDLNDGWNALDEGCRM